MLSGRRRDESGAVAIMFAFLTVVLFMLAALSVDIGNAIARRTDTQSQADYGAFAAAAQQLQSATAGMSISPAMQNAVVTAMNDNQPQDDTSTCWRTKSCVSASQLRVRKPSVVTSSEPIASPETISACGSLALS